MDIGERVDHAWSTVSLVVDVVTLSGHQLTGGRLSSSGWPRQPNYLALVVGLRGDMRATEQSSKLRTQSFKLLSLLIETGKT